MIQFDSVTKKYRGTPKPALDNVNLRVQRGEFVFIVGASGSGKSSCLRLILREEQATSGSIHVLGHDLHAISNRKVPYFRRNLGVVFQDFRLLANKTVHDNVAFTLQVIGKSRGFIQEAVPDTLEMVGLGGKGKRYPHELSGGEQQRVAIARAIVNKPAILLADEPTGNLDPGTSLGIMQLLQAINAAGTTVIMATHEAGFVDIMQQRVIELSQGVVVRDDKQGGYGVTAAVPVAVDLAARDTPLVLRQQSEQVTPEPAAQPQAAAHPEPTTNPEPRMHPEPVKPQEPVVQVSPEPRLDDLLAQSAAKPVAQASAPAPVTNPPGMTLAEPETVNPEPSSSEPRAAEVEQVLHESDPLALSQTGILAQQLGLDTHGDDDDSDVGPVR